MDAVSYINKTYTILSDISPKNYAKLARNNIDGKLYVLKYLKAYEINVYKELQKLNETGIVKIFEVIDSPQGLYVVEEYVDGCTLEEFFERVKVNPENKLNELLMGFVIQVLTALVSLHGLSSPIIHRDIKPENILIDHSGKAKLIDFNISREYTGVSPRDTIAMGTSDFAAPEQYGFFESDPRTDIYGVGATTKYIMNKYDITSEPLSRFIEKAMAFKPDERFENANAALYYLKNYYKIKMEEERKAKELENANSWRRFLPPGFRKGRTSHIIIACFSYFIMFVHTYYTIRAIQMIDTEMKGKYVLVIILIWSWFFLLSGFSFDYLGVHSIFKINELTGFKKVLAIIGVDILIVVITLFIGAFFVNKV